MQRLVFSSLLVFFAFLFFPHTISAQEWETFESTDFNIKISVPPNWKTSTGTQGDLPYLEATSPDESVFLFIYVYKDDSISTKDLLNNAIHDLGIKLEGESAQENLNGMDAWVASGIGSIENVEVGMFIAAATYHENNYIAYIFTSIESINKNSEVMNKIIDSLSPINK